MSVDKDNLSEWVRAVRARLGLSQSELGSVLGVSSRAVQSYEQGWRALPRPVATQLMTVLAIHGDHPDHFTPCWKITGCPEETRSRCTSFKISKGRFCWLMAGTACGGSKAAGQTKGTSPCVGCVVVRSLLDATRKRTPAGH